MYGPKQPVEALRSSEHYLGGSKTKQNKIKKQRNNLSVCVLNLMNQVHDCLLLGLGDIGFGYSGAFPLKHMSVSTEPSLD